MGLGPCTLSVTHRLYENTLDLVSIEGSDLAELYCNPIPSSAAWARISATGPKSEYCAFDHLGPHQSPGCLRDNPGLPRI
jgi:hypothetical protein